MHLGAFSISSSYHMADQVHFSNADGTLTFVVLRVLPQSYCFLSHGTSTGGGLCHAEAGQVLFSRNSWPSEGDTLARLTPRLKLGGVKLRNKPHMMGWQWEEG